MNASKCEAVRFLSKDELKALFQDAVDGKCNVEA
jgi:hypothetical protein